MLYRSASLVMLVFFVVLLDAYSAEAHAQARLLQCSENERLARIVLRTGLPNSALNCCDSVATISLPYSARAACLQTGGIGWLPQWILSVSESAFTTVQAFIF